jgi:prolyl-tRNA editing enzyme YbaK/EbsC (Cys-tRNA(Pro) deacylase)
MLVGGVTPFGLPEGIPIFVDDAVMGREWIILGSGGRSSKLKLAPEALRQIPGLSVVPGLAHAKRKAAEQPAE